jgi:hypothetical protein
VLLCQQGGEGAAGALLGLSAPGHEIGAYPCQDPCPRGCCAPWCEELVPIEEADAELSVTSTGTPGDATALDTYV